MQQNSGIRRRNNAIELPKSYMIDCWTTKCTKLNHSQLATTLENTWPQYVKRFTQYIILVLLLIPVSCLVHSSFHLHMLIYDKVPGPFLSIADAEQGFACLSSSYADLFRKLSLSRTALQQPNRKFNKSKEEAFIYLFIYLKYLYGCILPQE